MKRKKIITICSSAAFYQDVLAVEKELKKMGFLVKVPKTARIMHKNNDFDVTHYKTWFGNKDDYHKKTALMDAHLKKVIAADAIFVLNNEKNGIQGYIGGNVLMEMTLAFHYKEPIFIYNPISEDLGIKEEIYGLQPIFLNQNLQELLRFFS